MEIVSVDSHRRIYLPKDLEFKARKAIIITRGETYVLIPIPDEVTEIDIDAPAEELRRRAEEKARREAANAHRV